MPRHDYVEHEVVRRCPVGHALVLRCYPLRERGDRIEPFPTLYWLECKDVAARIARLEYGGAVGELEARIAADPAFRAAVHADHDAYVAERWELLRPTDRARVAEAGLTTALLERGIGGLANRDAVKCLHLHYAHHLAVGSTLGRAIEELDPHGPGPIPLCH